jgi:hypothetical protein
MYTKHNIPSQYCGEENDEFRPRKDTLEEDYSLLLIRVLDIYFYNTP